MNTLQSYWTRLSHWWDGFTPTGKILLCAGSLLLALLLWHLA